MLPLGLSAPLLLAFLLASQLVKSDCPLLNHFPPPHLQSYPPTADPILGRYLKALTTTFDDLSSNTSAVFTRTSFSILISHPNHSEQTASGPIWQYHYTAEATDPRGTKNVTSDTVFRVASVSKLLTMVGVVKAGLDLDASIVKYIPELIYKSNAVGARTWEEVTVRSLGSHLAGVQRFFGISELGLDPAIPEESDLLLSLGFPPLPKSAFPPCEHPLYNPQSCTTKQFLEEVSSHPPVIPPFSQPIYSNAAYSLLAIAIERVKSISFEIFMQKEVFSPLNMTRSSFLKLAKESEGSIPPFSSTWGLDYGSQSAGGALYSTSSDLSKLLLSLLPSVQNKKPILQPHPIAADKFLLPASMVPSTNTFILGAPWEIYRPEANHGGLTIYTKSGGMSGYSAQAVLIPEYDITMTITVSGDVPAKFLLNKILSYPDDGKEKGLLVGGFGEVARREAKEAYDGIYVSETKKLNSSMELSTEKNGTSGGIIVSDWVSNGSNFLDTLALLQKFSGGAADVDARLYPVDLYGTVVTEALTPGGKLSKVRKEEWKVTIENKQAAPTTTPESPAESGKLRTIFEGICLTFSSVELARWADENLNRVVIWRSEARARVGGKRGKIIAVEIPALRVVLRNGVQPVSNQTSA
ncbi:beta-lactamase/transpeptidase-like protein [Tirmania nivea]|nr:beta-lactamase/transpeptidase-like protein [Tirmania nivea]